MRWSPSLRRMVSNFGNAAPTICLSVYIKLVEQRFSVSRSTATGILQQMEKNGYLHRVSVERDARLKKLVLTEKAIRYHFHIVEEVRAMEECLVRDISPEELELFFSVVERMQENIRKDRH